MKQLQFDTKYVSTLEATTFNSIYNAAKPLINRELFTTDWEQMFQDEMFFNDISLYLKTARPAAIISLIELVLKLQEEIKNLESMNTTLQVQVQEEQTKFENFMEKTTSEIKHWRNQCELYQEKEKMWDGNQALYGEALKKTEGL